MEEHGKGGETATAPPNVHNGTYTVSHPERGHFTLKLYTAAPGGALEGKRIVSLLTGPDNVNDYAGVAFWDDERKVANMWRRHRGAGSNGVIDGYNWNEKAWSMLEKKVAIWADLAKRAQGESYWRGEGYVMDLAGRCVRCNKVLTDPESIALGIGPKCGGRS